MYFQYRVTDQGPITEYRSPEQVSMFGCNSGLIPAMLRQEQAGGVPAGDLWKWHLPVQDLLRAQGTGLVIDLKPKARLEGTASLYELRDVWGHTRGGWTPLMLRLRALSIDGSPAISDWRDFEVGEDDVGAVYTFLFVNGGISERRLTGKWTFSSPSSTNSVLLFGEHLKHFSAIIRQHDPHLLAAG